MISYFLQLVRVPNLLIIALLQYLLYYVFLSPRFTESGIEPQLDDWHFAQFTIFTVLLAAGGYVINDIMDQRADRINRPNRQIIGRHISLRSALWLYFCFNLIAFLLWLYLSFHVQRLPLLIVFAVIAFGLYLYSSFLKRQPLLGHLLIAGYCSAVVGVLWLIEYPSIVQVQPGQGLDIQRVLGAYAAFAFLATLLRELIKTLQDEHGDRQAGYRTTAIVWGQPLVRRVAILLSLLLLAAIWLIAWYLLPENMPLSLAALITSLPLLVILIGLWRQPNSQATYARLSKLSKWLMLLGILTLFLLK